MVSNVKVHDRDAITLHLLKRLCGDQPCAKLSTVRRNLFGLCEKKVTEQNNQAYDASLDKEFKDKAKKASREWNFDFVKGVPLPGKYVWERVHSYEVPSWYAAISRPTLKDALTKEASHQNRSVVDENTCLSKSGTEIRFTGLKEITERKRDQPSKKPRLVQTSMKDFTRVQKRRSSRRLQLKQLQLYSGKNRLLRNHHLPLHPRSVVTC